MIDFHYKTNFKVEEGTYIAWLNRILSAHNVQLRELSFIFLDDEELCQINQSYLKRDYYTDVISFSYGTEKEISGDIFISIDRIRDNAATYNCDFESELHRVMSHGLLHLIGYGDDDEEKTKEMRKLEKDAMELFHVEH